jgi:hypothetical protein
MAHAKNREVSRIKGNAIPLGIRGGLSMVVY